MSTFSKFSYNDMVNMLCGGDLYPFLDLVQDSDSDLQDVQGSMPLGDAIQFLLDQCDQGNVEMQVEEKHLSSYSGGRYDPSVDEEDPRRVCEVKFILCHERVLLAIDEAGVGVWQWVNRKCSGKYAIEGGYMGDRESVFKENILEIQVVETWSTGDVALCWYAGEEKKQCNNAAIQELVTSGAGDEGGYDDLPF